jgi:hypothetical protein
MLNRELTNNIVARVQGVLKPNGFRKSGQTFTRDRGEVVHLINLQKSQSSSSDEVKITVNLAVWIKALAPIRAGVTDKPNVASSHWRQRIGFLSPQRYDKWWTVEGVSSAQLAGEEIATDLEEWGLPALDGLSSVQALVDLWNGGESPGLTSMECDRYLRALTKGNA